MSANADDQFRFINLLALELNNGDISLPSLPDVVIKIRKMLENDDADFDKISGAVSVDPVLVSKLFVFANSALYNRAGVTIDTLDAAIGRLGFEVVRNTAMSIAMEQLYSAETNSVGKAFLRRIWERGIRLSCMGWSIARHKKLVNEESAYLAGLMHDIGTLYVVTKSSEFPDLLGDEQGFRDVVSKWKAQIGKSIIESWGFNEEMAESADTESYLVEGGEAEPQLVDVMDAANRMVNAGSAEQTDFEASPSFRRLCLDSESSGTVFECYEEKLASMQTTLG